MAKAGDIVEHPVTGETITFLDTAQDTGGEYTRAEVRVAPHGFVAAPHVHPRIEETFEILSGAFTFVVDGEERRIKPGEEKTIPAGSPHAWWNSGDEEGVAIVTFRPAMKTEEFFESFFGLAQDGKVNPKSGLPNLLWLAAMFRAYRRDFAYIARPPLWLQFLVFTPLAAAGKPLGYGMPYPYPRSRKAGPRVVSAGETATKPGPPRSGGGRKDPVSNRGT